MAYDPAAPATLLNGDVDRLFAHLKDLVDNTKRIAVALEKIAAPAAATPTLTVDIDAGDGDVVVPFAPKAWKGDTMKGKRMSECPSDFLDVLAGALEGMAANPKEGKEKFARGNLVLAAKARAWAKRKRANGETTETRPGGFVD